MTDRRTVLAVIGFLGLVGAVLASSLAFAVVSGKDVNEAVLTLLSAQLGAVVGALGSMLVHTGSVPSPGSVTTTVEDAGDEA